MHNSFWMCVNQAYSIVSMMFVMAAISGCCLETIPSLQDRLHALRYTSSCSSFLNASDPTEVHFQRLLPQPIYALRILDYLCNSFFSVELLIRLVVAPRPLTFIKSPITIIDIVAIIPFYLMLLFDVIFHTPCKVGKGPATFLQVVFLFRIIRVFRVFQMLAYFKPLKILIRSLRDSVYELLILLVFILICILVFATLAFYVEINYKDSNFDTIPIGFWWALITITTVGYGDIYPRTTGGYLVGAACALCGTVIMALTIPILSNNFTLYYTHSRTRDRATVKEKLRESKEEQSGGPKKSVLDDGSIMVRKSKKSKAGQDFEEALTFRRASTTIRSQHELNHEKVVLVGQGEIGTFQTKSPEKVVSNGWKVAPNDPNGSGGGSIKEETTT